MRLLLKNIRFSFAVLENILRLLEFRALIRIIFLIIIRKKFDFSILKIDCVKIYVIFFLVRNGLASVGIVYYKNPNLLSKLRAKKITVFCNISYEKKKRKLFRRYRK